MTNSNEKSLIFQGRTKKIELCDIIIFGIIAILMGISLFSFYPAIMTDDSNVQWGQIQTGIYHPWHPIFHTFLEYLITRVWNNPAMISIVQIIVFASAFTLICKVTRERTDSIWVKVTQALVCIVICMFPVNYLYSVTLWKDVLYSFALLLYAYFILKGIRYNFKYKRYEYILIAILFGCICLIRHNGLVVVGLTMFILAIYSIKKKNIKKYLSFLILFLVIFGIFKLPEKLLPKSSGNMKYKQGVFLHLTGAFLSNNEITDESDLEFLNNILDLEIWKNGYTPFTHDPITLSTKVNDAYLQENSKELQKIVIKYAVKNPGTVIKHYFYLTSVLWSPVSLSGPSYVGATVSDANNYGNMVSPKLQITNNILTNLFKYTKENSFIYFLLYRPALHMYLSIAIILFVCKIRKNKKYLLVLLPMLFNVISLIPALPAQDFRYSYINFLTLCFCVILLANEIIRMCKDDKKRAVILYLIFGGITTVINIFTYQILANIFNINFAISNIIAWLLSVIVAYITNKLYVFDSRNKSGIENSKELLKFILVRIFSLGIDMLVMLIGIRLFKINDFIVKVLANIVVIITNYFMSKYIVFKKEK